MPAALRTPSAMDSGSWESLGLRPEGLIERFQRLLAQALQPDAGSSPRRDPQPHAQAHGCRQRRGIQGQKRRSTWSPSSKRWSPLNGCSAFPTTAAPPKQTHVEPAMIETALDDIAHQIADECEQKLAELAVTLLEDPNYRLAGAEEALAAILHDRREGTQVAGNTGEGTDRQRRPAASAHSDAHRDLRPIARRRRARNGH